MSLRFQPAIYTYGSPQYELALELRRDLLRLPLGLDFSEQDIEEERQQVFIGAFDEDYAVATLTLVPNGHDCKMRQVAVHPDFQGKGFGAILVRFAEVWAKEKGCSTMTLHARVNVVPFYQKLGYQSDGPVFSEVTIPHQKMTKNLASALDSP